MPKKEIFVDPSESYLDSTAQSASGSIADSATTNIKALVAGHPDDQKFVYKKNDNYVVLLLKLYLPKNFNHETSELYFGFQMTTTCSRFN